MNHRVSVHGQALDRLLADVKSRGGAIETTSDDSEKVLCLARFVKQRTTFLNGHRNDWALVADAIRSGQIVFQTTEELTESLIIFERLREPVRQGWASGEVQ